MPVEQVVRIVTAVASALDYAHKQGLLHRDVKPANIMLTHLDDDGEQRILLADFGIARNVDDISGLTTTNMTVGTVAYAAPEQLMGEDIDGRADQYALAATAYHLLTGSQLFPHSNPAVVISRHLNSPPPALADTRPDLATSTRYCAGTGQEPRRPLRPLHGLRPRIGRRTRSTVSGGIADGCDPSGTNISSSGAVSHDAIGEAKRHAALAVVVDSCRRRGGTHSHGRGHSRVAAMVIPRRIDEHTGRSSSCVDRRTDNDHNCS